jgi:Major capsid protein N-terminus/Large eukaryotic DNA virus major capsid protein
MGGGLIQLAAYGVQDLFLTKEPQITFFKIVYRRHTNFTTEIIPLNFLQTPDFGKRITCVLSRNGDLIRKLYISFVLPTIPQFIDANQNPDPIAMFAWIRNIGFGLINTIDIEIGGELIDRQYGDWLNIWYELTVRDQHQENIILGNIPDLINFSNGKSPYQLFVPLQFWFNRITGLALPIVSLQYNHIQLDLEISDFSDCYILAPTNVIFIDNDFVNFTPFEFIEQSINGGVAIGQYIYFDLLSKSLYFRQVSTQQFISLTVNDPSLITTLDQQRAILYAQNPPGTFVNEAYFINGLTSGFQAMPAINSVETAYVNNSVNFDAITLSDCFVLAEYVYLDDDERIRFSQARHEYLIEQLSYDGIKSVNGLTQSFKIGFTQPCKELVWVTQLTLALQNNNNDNFNYTDSLIRDINGNTVGNNIILQETILFNGLPRISLRDSQYFSLIQPYQNHTHAPSTGINVYSFGIHPEKHQPSGTANFSAIDDITLQIIVESLITFSNTAQLRTYGWVYNVLRIANGVSGLVFSIDY